MEENWGDIVMECWAQWEAGQEDHQALFHLQRTTGRPANQALALDIGDVGCAFLEGEVPDDAEEVAAYYDLCSPG